ncbi:MAG: carbohydrate binding domain-containing protein [Candidatus Poribacteria bacterium]
MSQPRLCSVLFLALALTSHAVDNMILNGDFEDGDQEWLTAARVPAVVEWAIDSDEFISGSQSVRCEVLNVGAGGVHDLTLDSQSAIEMEAGDTYTVDFWVKAEEDRTITIDFIMNHDPWSRMWQVESIPITTTWAVQHHTWDADFSDDSMIFLFSFSKASNVNPDAVMWIDNVRLYAGEFDEQDLGRQPKAIDSRDRLATRWAVLKERS